ncbi:MAG: ABC transporter permease subunit [Methanosarcinales archaeon]|uniref:ABC transporter permease subunit n=1 Tax=Candidatus Ethanoperedens thermophilum TaxID=2766897 RepID=A0A848DAL7_9EURY|nr:ABC transporter permease subunit [Candidatus Ethanoperedens thermophilum]
MVPYEYLGMVLSGKSLYRMAHNERFKMHLKTIKNVMKKLKKDRFLLLFFFSGFFLVAFVFVTLGDMFYRQTGDMPALIGAAKNSTILTAIWISISAASVSALIAFIFGVPLAYILARKDFAFKSVIEGIIDIPIMIPHVVAGIALYGVFMRSGIIGAPFGKLGIVFVDAFPGIVAAMLFMSLPYLVDTAREGFKTVDPRLENVSRSLGASQWTTFRKITFPLASPSIFNGCILCWARGVSEFSAVLIIAYFPKSAPVMIYDLFTMYGLTSSRPASILLVSICLVIFIILRASKHGEKR